MKLRIMPWLTDGSVDFLNNVFKWYPTYLGRQLRVLEFGCGNSTLYFASKGCSVVSIESTQKYRQATEGALNVADTTRGCFVGSVEFLHAETLTDVPEDIWTLPFDIVLVDGPDGMARHKTLERFAESSLLASSLLIVDNVEYMSNWGNLDIHAAYPARVVSFRRFYRDVADNVLIFETPWGRDGGALADAVGFEAHARVMTAVSWSKEHEVFGKSLLTTTGLPVVSPEGFNDADLATLRARSSMTNGGGVTTGTYEQTYTLSLERD